MSQEEGLFKTEEESKVYDIEGEIRKVDKGKPESGTRREDR